MSTLSIDLRVADPAWQALEAPEPLARRAFGAAAQQLKGPVSGEVAILLTGDAELRALNAKWRGRDYATDILSFPPGDTGEAFLGDLALGFGACSRDAGVLGLTLADHITHLLIHGFFHLRGLDHECDDEALTMEAMEAAALARLGLHNPYRRGD
ncbi:MAG: rRNA maturation RNase YbeY [Pseudomonadota bacterium]